MRAPAFCAVLAALFAASEAADAKAIEELSFGQSGRLNPDGSPGRVPHFTLSGHPHQPELLSNKIILTPVAPGNQRGALWADNPLARSFWSAHIDFRANGPERGGGNLNVWLVHGGSSVVGSNSIYTVGKFDGLGVVIDAHGRSGGMVRGFLNDGTVDYAQQHDIDRLAFGHCQYAYRNLGRPSRLSLVQTAHSFRVEVDSRLCFETEKASLPSGNFLGITAATPDTPDSFELFSMVVSSDSTQDIPPHHAQQKQPAPPAAAAAPDAPHYNQPADESADHFTTSAAQFRDLHDRLQGLTHHLASISAEIANYDHHSNLRNDQVNKALDALRSRLPAGADLIARVKDLEMEVRAMRNDINKKLSSHHDSFQDYLSEHHDSLTEAMVHHMPGHGKIIFVVVASQVVFALGYVLYKRRKASSPKKYL
ncbi:hypothetical protein XA68_11012 [Ophiocordyceps unilateralis]|uniref:L-type lectin-like domain-containing protein n=1 Tax=Ophiocordyceps unilateralis TaxID=268505 RepID=A0A2A9PGT7_OPHUN|nr:hypothetical protein XA68_11012 [Ophiocordyceps unilateralis]